MRQCCLYDISMQASLLVGKSYIFYIQMQVSVLEGNNGVWVVRNLSVHMAASEEVAQNLLLQGQANRRVAATTVHDRSSRSHAVFTVQLSAKQSDSDVYVK